MTNDFDHLLEYCFLRQKGHRLFINEMDLCDLMPNDEALYIVNINALQTHLTAYKQSLSSYYPGSWHVFYAAKAFLNLAMAHLIRKEGVGIDVCSGGELFVSDKAGFSGNQIIFNGNNKTDQELSRALQKGLFSINIDSHDEFERLMRLNGAGQARIMLRVNPEIDVDTHPAIATGVRGSKFGISMANNQAIDLIQKMHDQANFCGIHFHIGSQILDLCAYQHALRQAFVFIQRLNKQAIPVQCLNIGGGLGISPHQSCESLIRQWVKTVSETIIDLCSEFSVPIPELVIEPGRSIVARAGLTLYRVGTIKESEDFTFLAVNGGMSDNIRPALLGAYYRAVLPEKMGQPLRPKPYRIVGNCCESGDVLIQNIHLPQANPGDYLAVLETGAYCHSLSSQYNKHPGLGVVFVGKNGYFFTATKAQSFDQLVENDLVPENWT